MTTAGPSLAIVGELLHNAPCGYVSFDDGGKILAANRTLAVMLGYDTESLTGQSLEVLLTTPSRIFYQTHFFPILRLHGRADEMFLTLRAQDGAPVHVLGNAVRTRRDGVWANDCVFIRIQERHKYEDALLRARKAAEESSIARMRFLSMMSHDLRTPLNAISGYADLMLMGIRGDITDAQRRDLERVKDASAFLLGMLNDILAFVKYEAGQLEISVHAVPLREVVAQAEHLVEPRLRTSDIVYERLDCTDNVVAAADEVRLQQVLLNLLTNAIKFTPRGGRIMVRCARRDDRVEIHVADTGPGIAPDRLTWIFEPFTQLEHRSAASKEGVGLGLAISRQLARAMGGDVTVASELGRGSTFTISMPSRQE